MAVTVMDDRAKTILDLVVRNYIKTGVPVGSFALVRDYRLPWSSATVRYVMAHLSELGYLTKPHSSAGRLPTEKGIRYYIDYLFTKPRLPRYKRLSIRRRYMRVEGTLEEVVAETSSILSDITHFAGIATVPRTDFMTIKSAELVKLSEDRVLVMFVLEGGITEKTLIRVGRPVQADMLERMSRYLNELAVGFTMEEFKRKVVKQIKHEKEVYRMLVDSLESMDELMRRKTRSSVFVKGQGTIFDTPGFDDPSRLRDLVKTLDEKEVLYEILNVAMKGDGVRVLVGSANGIVEGCSVIVAPYGFDKRKGTVGVFGPMRMDYSQVIPIVEYTAGVVSNLLAEGGL